MAQRPPTYRAYRPIPRVRRIDTRATAYERGYDDSWRELRNRYIAQHPMCEWPRCQYGADIVDHVLPVDEYPELRLKESNLQSLCRSHHGVKTAMDQRRKKEMR